MENNNQIIASTSLPLKSGDKMPLLGFGTWKISKDICADTVYKAIKSGYRLLDCACDYGNQQQVGDGIKKAIQEKIVKRQDLFITSKLWNTFHHPSHVRQGFMKTLKDLKLDYVDLYLIHFPIALKYVPIQTRYPPEWVYDPTAKTPCMQQQNVPLIQTWRVMQQLVNQKLVRNIGVSNFTSTLLRDFINSAKIIPAVLQIQIHPYLTQKNMIRFCQEKGIQITSFSTLGASSYLQLSSAKKQEVISQNQFIQSLSKKHNKSPYQIVLRWAIQQNLAIIPKTVNQQRMKQNLDLIGWQLSEQQMKKIDSLNKNRRYNDPGVFCQAAFNTFFPIYD